MTDQMKKLRDEMAHEFVNECPKYSGYPEHMKTYLAGFDACYEALLKAGPEIFDNRAAKKASEVVRYETFVDSSFTAMNGFMEGAQYQHSILAAQIAALRAENEELKEYKALYDSARKWLLE